MAFCGDRRIGSPSQRVQGSSPDRDGVNHYDGYVVFAARTLELDRRTGCRWLTGWLDDVDDQSSGIDSNGATWSRNFVRKVLWKRSILRVVVGDRAWSTAVDAVVAADPFELHLDGGG